MKCFIIGEEKCDFLELSRNSVLDENRYNVYFTAAQMLKTKEALKQIKYRGSFIVVYEDLAFDAGFVHHSTSKNLIIVEKRYDINIDGLRTLLPDFWFQHQVRKAAESVQ